MRLITPYPAHPQVDRVLEILGDVFYHDDVHCLTNGDDDTAVAEGDIEATNSSSDEDDWDAEPAQHDPAQEHGPAIGVDESAELEGSDMETAPVSANEADAVHKVKATMASLEASIEGLRAIGSLRGVHCLHNLLRLEKRKVRKLIQESPAVADAFLQLRTAEDKQLLMSRRIAEQHNDRKREAAKVIADRDVAVVELRETKRKIQDMESICASKHAIRTFTLETLGEGDINAGGPKARKHRFEVLDRLSRIGAKLSSGQKNDFDWFKVEWDKEMVKQYGATWASLFAKWMQNVLNDECSNAFSMFVYKETCRLFSGTVALHVPGV